MVGHGYKIINADHCVYVKRFGDTDFITLLLYMDDMLLIGKDMGKLDKLNKDLSKSFDKRFGTVKENLRHINQA